MEGKSIVASLVVGILGLISTGLGLTFELMSFNAQARLFHFKCTSDLCVAYKCMYFRSPAFYMVIGAIGCLIVALIIISISANCGCGRRTHSSSASRGLAILAFVFCWLTCVTAIILFLIAGATHYGLGIAKNGGSISFNREEDNICFRVKRGVFGAAAGLSFVGITLGMISYITLVSEDFRVRRTYQVESDSEDFRARRTHQVESDSEDFRARRTHQVESDYEDFRLRFF